MWAAAIPAIAAVGSAVISSNASNNAANTQARAAERAAKTQERIFNRQVELQAPFRDAGLTANNRLAYLLGLSSEGYGSSSPALTAEQLRNELLKDFTTTETVSYKPKYVGRDSDNFGKSSTKAITKVDEAGLNAAIQQRLAQQAQQQAQQQSAAAADPNYGSLMRNFGMEDFQADPGYAFRQSEGMKGIEGGAAARGGLLSGGALKAIQKYGQDLASQEYGNAYGRFNANQTNQYNRLAGIVNTGQGATNQITNAAGNLGSQLGSNIIGTGNANAAATIGQANAWNNAIGTASNAYQTNQLMNLIQRPGSSGFTPSYGTWDNGNYQID